MDDDVERELEALGSGASEEEAFSVMHATSIAN